MSLSSILDPLCCGFAKVAIYELKYKSSIVTTVKSSVTDVSKSMGKQHEQFVSEFQILVPPMIGTVKTSVAFKILYKLWGRKILTKRTKLLTVFPG